MGPPAVPFSNCDRITFPPESITSESIHSLAGHKSEYHMHAIQMPSVKFCSFHTPLSLLRCRTQSAILMQSHWQSVHRRARDIELGADRSGIKDQASGRSETTVCYPTNQIYCNSSHRASFYVQHSLFQPASIIAMHKSLPTNPEGRTLFTTKKENGDLCNHYAI